MFFHPQYTTLSTLRQSNFLQSPIFATMRKSSTTVRVQGFHLDRYGHVNNARYLEFLEMGRWDFIRDFLDMQLMEQRNWGFFVTNINIDYKTAATLDDFLQVVTVVQSIGPLKSTMYQEIYNKENTQLVATAKVTFVMMNLKSSKVLRVRKEVKAFLASEPYVEKP